MFRYTRSDGVKETPMFPFALLFVATLLFPGLIYFQTLKNTKVWMGKFVPTGGLMHMVFWVSLCFFYQPPKLD